MGEASNFISQTLDPENAGQDKLTQPSKATERAESAVDFIRERLKRDPEAFATGGIPSIGGEELARSVGRKRLAATRKRLGELRLLDEAGIDVDTGASFATRMDLALTPPDRRRVALEELFPEGFRETSAGIIFNKIDPETGQKTEVLLDEEGLSVGDLADATPALVEVLGAATGVIGVAIAAPELLTGGILSLGVAAVIAGVSGQLGIGIIELVQAARHGGLDIENPSDRKLIVDIIKRRGVNAAIDTVLDVATAGTGRFLSRSGQVAIGPFARKIGQSPQKEILEAAERQDVTPSIGTITGSPTIQRAEGFAEKIPGSAGPMRARARKETQDLEAAQDRLSTGTRSAAEVGEDISVEVTQRKAELQEAIDLDLQEAARVTELRMSQLSAKYTTRGLSMNEAGELSRRGLERARRQFKNGQKLRAQRTTDLIEKLPEEKRAFASSREVKRTAISLRNQFPKQKVISEKLLGIDDFGNVIVKTSKEEKLIGEFFPEQIKKFVAGAGKLPDNITVQELRNVRNVVAQTINDVQAFPGVGVGGLKKLEVSLTTAIRRGADRAPTPQIKASIIEELDHFKNGIGKFQTKAVARALRTENLPGFVEGEDVLPTLILRNKTEDARRVIKVLGENSIPTRAAKRAVFDKLLLDSQESFLREGTINIKTLAKQYNKLNSEAKDLLLGATRKEFEELLQLGAARIGLVDVAVITASPGNNDILSLLRTATGNELNLRADFERAVFRPILKGELDAAKMNPEEFVRFAVRNKAQISDKDLSDLMRKLPEELQDQVRKRVVVDILDQSASRGKLPDLLIEQVSKQTTGVGTDVLDIMKNEIGLKRLRNILGDEIFTVLVDIGTLQSARQIKRDAAQAAGGLAAGTIIRSMANLKIGTAFEIAKFRIIAAMLSARPIRAWLKSQARLKTRTSRSQAFQLILPQLIRLTGETFGEQSETAAAFNQFFSGAGFKRLLGIQDSTSRVNPLQSGR